MDISTLAKTLATLVQGNMLSISADDAQKKLASTDIVNLFTHYLNGTLSLSLTTPKPIVTNTTITYQGQMSFLQQTLDDDAIFYLTPDGTPELTLALNLPNSWS